MRGSNTALSKYVSTQTGPNHTGLDTQMIPSSPHKPIMIVGEYQDEHAEGENLPYGGGQKYALLSMLRQVGIAESDCHITLTIFRRAAGNRLESFFGYKDEAVPNYRPIAPGKYLHKKWQSELDRLFAEIESVRPNVIIAAGNLPLWALTKKSGIKKHRGSPLPTFDNKYKVIPTWPVSSVFRQWELRPVVLADLNKAKRESTSPALNRPEHFIHMYPSLPGIEVFYHEYLVGQPFLSCDIETKNKTITEVGFGTADGRDCLVIPFWDREVPDGNYWPDLKSERAAWAWVRRLCTEFPLIGQNFSYDMQYLWRTVGIPCPKFLGDTMIMHHSLQPEMEKGLGFLGSIYTDEPSWKFMRTDHATLKREDD